MKYQMIFIPIMIFMFFSCDKEEQNSQCFSFDVRQCQTDEFANDVPESDPVNQRELKMVDWFEEQGVEIDEVKLLVGYHDAVCEACDVCPLGDRYFIRLKDNSSAIDDEELRLLNYESVNCGDIF